jgi:hypothetical protein
VNPAANFEFEKNPSSRPHVLVVEDEVFSGFHAANSVEAAGFISIEASNADEAITILESRKDLRIVFTDIDMPGSSGPFLYVLVGNWIFALAFFLAFKFAWHWVPAEWNTPGDKIALVFQCAAFALLPGVVAICIVAAQRLNPDIWVGRTAKPNSALDINTRFILNTFEQFTAYWWQLQWSPSIRLQKEPARCRS